MTKSKSSKNADKLTKTSKKGAVELSEAALSQASGGAVFPSMPVSNNLKLDTQQKWTDPSLLVPAVNKG